MHIRTFPLSSALLAVIIAGFGCSNDDETVTTTGAGMAAGVADLEPRQLVTEAQAIIEPLGDSGLSGTVTFAPTDLGMQVSYVLTGLPTGVHGIHVHENGSCAEGPDGAPAGAAGGHFNPDDSPHGAPNLPASERHAGDLGNLHSLSDAPDVGSFNGPIATLDGPHNIVGKALIIHSGEDDFVTQPTGNAGARIGCGVITAVKE